MTIFFHALNSQLQNALIARIALLNSLIYFVTDLAGGEKGVEVWIHHIVAAAACTGAAMWDDEVGLWVQRGCGVLEFTNPCWTFFRLRISKSSEILLPEVYSKRAAGIIFSFFFLPVRLIYFPLAFWKSPESLPREFFFAIWIPLMLLNLYWSGLLFRGIIRELKST